jgi:UDPglucose--hexose-1-phosphate uridylyltransferase
VLETLFHRRDLVGAHEIVIETPVHCASLTQIPLSDLVLVLEAYRSRLLHWRAHHGIQYAVIFKNVGPFAGASLVHAHSQLIATSFVPPDVQRVCARLDHFLREQGTGYWTSVVREELSRGDRMVAETDHFAVFCPFASPLPYSVTLIPKQPQSLFEEMPPRHHEELAEAIYRMLKSIELVLYQASYNYVLHTCPFDMQGGGGFQWRLEAFPRLTTQAGFELGSSCFINPVMPETAAAELRRAWRKEDRT